MGFIFKGNVFILNKPFEGSWTDQEGNVAHEIIDYFRADNGKIYIFNNPYGKCPENIDVDKSKEYKVEFMFLAKKATIIKKDEGKKDEEKKDKESVCSKFELTHLIKIKQCLHYESTHKNKKDLQKAQDKVKAIIKREQIEYAGKPLDQIYGDEDDSLYVTFEAEKIYHAKNPIMVTTKGYRFQRNKGYVYSDESADTHEAYKALEEYTKCLNNYWEDITDKIGPVRGNNSKPTQNKTFLDLILKTDNEECYTNMLYMILDWKETMHSFAKKFSGGKEIDTSRFIVRREFKISQDKNNAPAGGRMDICAYTKKQRIVIENKVFSGLNGKDDTGKTQLSIYYNWAAQPGMLEPLCFIVCPDFKKAEIEAEMEPEMKDKYVFVEYSKIGKFIDAQLKRKDYFDDFQYKRYVQDIADAFKKIGYKDKLELFEQLFLETIQRVKP